MHPDFRFSLMTWIGINYNFDNSANNVLFYLKTMIFGGMQFLKDKVFRKKNGNL